MILHTINRSPFGSSCLQSCLDVAAAGSAIILIEDAVYAALPNTQYTDQIAAALGKHKFYALDPDLKARGIHEATLDGIESVDYDGFVALCTEFSKVVSWY
ncbi:MAG: sulfurtransferase complex subunit TusB [Pseudomonadales bacterium]|nr:sulfurtransferase complex subunit TusB [Pseudomonadales bacterium]